MICRVCKTENEAGALKCKTCGSELETVANTVKGGSTGRKPLIIGAVSLAVIIIGFIVYNYTVSGSGKVEKVTTKNRSTGIMPGSNTDADVPIQVSTPEDQVRGFLNDLGSRNFYAAYSRAQNPSWGSLEQFSSKSSYGGITGVSIDDVNLNYENGNEASVYADYTAYDPINKDGVYKQDFILNKIGQEWKIVKVTNLKIEQW